MATKGSSATASALTASAPGGEADTTLLLRRSVRLVHSLQKERGASCLYAALASSGAVNAVSSGGLPSVRVTQPHNDNGVRISNTLDCARKGTDTALTLFSAASSAARPARGGNGSLHDIPIKDTLERIRRVVDLVKAPSSGEDERKSDGEGRPGFHRMLVMFNTLLSDVVHSYIFLRVRDEQQRLERGRSVDMKDVADQMSPSTANPTSGQSSESKGSSLLSLLLSFVKLKESTGIERAVLTSLMAMCPQRRDTYSVLVNDLVLEVESQRTTVRELKSKTKKRFQSGVMDDNHKSLLALVEQSIELSPQMDRLQNMVRLDFDLVGFQKATKREEFWGLITLYIDKLHSLELLIIDELEGVLGTDLAMDLSPAIGQADEDAGFQEEKKVDVQSPKTKPHGTSLSDANSVPSLMVGVIESIAGESNRGPHSRQDALQMLESMSADQLKDSMLSLLRTSDNAPVVHASSSTAVNEQSKEDGAPVVPSQSMPSLNNVTLPKEWEIDLYEVKFKKRIGRGTAGTTYLAKWGGQNVAVKVAAITEMGLEGWTTEVQNLQRLHHPNIIRLLGSIYNPSPLTYCLVLEYCDAGDLSTALEKRTPPNFYFVVSGSIASGMAYLHSRNVLHRDIKPENVLLHGDVLRGKFAVKLTDFGLATVIQKENKTAETGTYRWMAPEVVRHESYSSMADVYSFAILSWQLITRENPFSKHSSIEAAGLVALDRARPPFPRGTPDEVVALITRCWREDPDNRLSFEKICSTLASLRDTLHDSDKSWLEEPFGHPVYHVPENAGEDVGQGTKPVTRLRKPKLTARAMSWHVGAEVESKKGRVDKKNLLSLFSKRKKR